MVYQLKNAGMILQAKTDNTPVLHFVIDYRQQN